MKEVYLVNCCRTAVGKFQGSLAKTPAPVMGGIVIKEALKRSGLKPENVDEVMFGNILTAALGQNPARQADIKAGIPYSVPAYTVGMVCGSGMKSVIEGARAIMAGEADVIVAGGMENMTAAPYAVPTARGGARMFNTTMVDTMVNDGLWDAFYNYHMGTTAENICDLWGITREDLDKFAASSQAKTAAAQAAGKFDDEIVPVPVKVKKETVEFKVDEFPRASSTFESLSKLKGAFPVGPESAAIQEQGKKIAAGDKNAEGPITMTFEANAIQGPAADAGQPRVTAGSAVAKLVSYGHGGVDPKIMGVGPVPATREALMKANLTIDDMDLIEANEAFAAQSVAVARELGFDMDKVNVNGGAISIGHPVGASGARIIVTLIHEMMKRDSKYGLATLCIGGGQGVATIWEKC